MKTEIEHCGLEEIIDLQLKAYNENDFETFASCYHKNIISIDLDSSEIIPHLCGEHFFNYYRKKLSENPTLNCQVIQRITHDNLIVDKEIISNFHSQPHQELVIYQIEHNLITKMWFTKETTT